MIFEIFEDFGQCEQWRGLLYFFYKPDSFIIRLQRKVAELCGYCGFDGDIASQICEPGIGILRDERMQIDAVKEGMQIATDFGGRIAVESLQPCGRIVIETASVCTENAGHIVAFVWNEAIDGGFEIAVLQEKPVSDVAKQLIGQRSDFGMSGVNVQAFTT